MTAFPWKLFKGATELVFPRGARRYVQFDVRQIQSDGAVELDWNANAVWTGDAAFRLHAVSMSCSDTTVAPISDLWQGDTVTLHAPFEFAVPGPAATLKYDPVPGSVYGVDADDNPVGSTASGSRTVSIAGAVAIRFRPIMNCRIVSRSGPGGSQGRADAGWSIEIIEQAGEVVDESDGDTISFAPTGLRTFNVGVPFELNLNPLVSTNTGMPVVFAPGVGTLPPGLTLSTNGYIAGTPTTQGLYVATVGAGSGTVLAVQTIPFYAALPTIASNGLALQNYTVGAAYSLDLATLVDVANTSASPTFALVMGALPAGLTLTGGVLSGTPTNYGAFAATFSATLPTGQTTEVSVAFFQQNPDSYPDAVLLGGTAQTWNDGSLNQTTYDARDFTASGTLTVVEAGWVEYILVGGGGGGGHSSNAHGGGGGGAGGFRRERLYLPAGTYTVSVGSGGASFLNGSPTSFNSTFTPAVGANIFGGGRGGSNAAGSAGGSTGSSGGGGAGHASAALPGGVAVSADYGSSGGPGAVAAAAHGGGGGGFSGVGMRALLGRGHGGHGIKVRLWSVLTFCGGGGGGSGNGTNTPGGDFTSTTNATGGGDGGYASVAAQAGAANSGGGGGGASGGASGTRNGGAGGSGRAIFIVKRRTAS